MRRFKFTEAIDDAIGQAMTEDPAIIIFGEDVPLLRRNLLVRFGPKRVKGAPISESAFLGAGVAAAMAGLRPIVEMYMVDFLGVCMDALINHAAKLDTFSGGHWQAPMVVRAPCGGGYGDGGQHEQCLWGWLAHIPGLSVVVPSNPVDAGGLMISALQQNGPVLFLEHKLMSESWLEFLGSGARKTVTFDVPNLTGHDEVQTPWQPIPFGRAASIRKGNDITLVSLGVGVHRAREAAEQLSSEGISSEIIDLRTVAPLDRDVIIASAKKTGRLVVIDEDYEAFGLSGEIAAVLLEAGTPVKYTRVCTKSTLPFARHLEDETLPNTKRILKAAKSLF